MRLKPKHHAAYALDGRRRHWPAAVRLGIVGVLIFMLGFGFGQGSFRLPHHATSQTGNLPSRLDYSQVDDVYKSLKDNYNGTLTESQLIDGLKHGLAEATKDPYTVYFTPKEAQDFNNQLNNSFAGIGARLSKDSDGNLTVGEAIQGYPAQKAGLQAQDIITKINGADSSGLTLDDAVLKIRGPAGSKVTLEIVRQHSQTLTFTIQRQEIKLPSVNTKILDNNVGYMQIISFSNDTADLAQKAATDFKAKGVKSVILDLRDDPGGLLDAAVKVSSLWLNPDTNVLQEKRGNSVVNSYEAEGGNTLHNLPTVVLINGGSASASEITAGALHDNKAAYVIGQKSYGKGVVQQLINFRDGAQLKVTVASWYRPDGENINKKGITPDKVVNISTDDNKAGNDTQLKAAQAYLASH